MASQEDPLGFTHQDFNRRCCLSSIVIDEYGPIRGQCLHAIAHTGCSTISCEFGDVPLDDVSRDFAAVAGFIVWEWRSYPGQKIGPKDPSYVPCGKKAMGVIRKYFQKPSPWEEKATGNGQPATEKEANSD